MILDSRAAAYEGMGNVKAALGDAKMCIDIAPTAIQVSTGFVPGERSYVSVYPSPDILTILAS